MRVRAVTAPLSSLGQPHPTLGRPAVRLFLTSAALLFVELLLIRWIPANVINVGFFSNFVLMGSFLGIGVGILYGRARPRYPVAPFPIVLLAVVALVSTVQVNVQLLSPDEIFFGLAESSRVDSGPFVLPLIVALVTVVMASLALPLGKLLTTMPPLRAYTIDILGSLAGIFAFTFLSALGTAPPVWFAVVAILISALGLGRGLSRWSVVTAATMGGVIAISILNAGGGDSWSPYYRISVYRSATSENINVDGIPHQAFSLLSADRHEAFYDQVYQWFPQRTFDRVLIVGAGTGTDTQIALAHGSKAIDAVEIDPSILAIGERDNPAQPFRDPRVDVHVDDGRAFLRKTDARYDLVVFALPDSLTLVSTTANLRLESFLFTEEAFASVRDHLGPDGVFVLYNYYRQPWLVQKLDGMLASAFGRPPLVRLYPHASGSAATLAAGPGTTLVSASASDALSSAGAPAPATDDWPFLYLLTPSIAPHYLIALGLILLWALVAVLRGAAVGGTSLRRFSPHFFVLGGAFLLLETRSLATFSLLFGSTWLVNALVFFAILASVLLAIGVSVRVRLRRPRYLYGALIAALAIAYLLPPQSLLLDPLWLRYVAASALAFAPVFCANLVFTYSFRDTRTADMAFASNLLGATVGGVLEYLSLLFGYGALLLVVAACYALAYVLATRFRFLADRELEATPALVAAEAPTG